jgi:regulator of protease activity HflC (stomatin/prohibitin superfamily)
MADVIIKTSGTEDAFKKKWARDYVRSEMRNCLGELTTEEFYDSSRREIKKNKAKKNINGILRKYGVEITDIVIPRKPHFYKEYEAMIKKKKLADQAVLEEKSKAQAAKQRQLTMIQVAVNRKNVAVEQFTGQMEQKIIKAEAEGERVKKSADAYYDKVTIGAQANLYEKQQQATGIMARKKAEAEGIERLKKALEGEGGGNMVKLEYAKKLKDIKITGKPFTIQGHIGKFEHNKASDSNTVK